MHRLCPNYGSTSQLILDWRSVIRLARNYSLIPPHCESLRQPVPLPPVPVALRDLQELCVVLVEMMVTSVLRDFVAMFAIFKNMILCPTATPNPTDSTLNQPEEFQEKKNEDGDYFRKLYLSNHGFAVAVILSFHAKNLPLYSSNSVSCVHFMSALFKCLHVDFLPRFSFFSGLFFCAFTLHPSYSL